MMATPATTKPITLDDLRAVDGLDEYKGMEIVDGVWTAKHEGGGMSVGHSRYIKKLLRILDDFVNENELGEVCVPETIFLLHQITPSVRVMRKPDIGFVSAPHVIKDLTEYYRVAPDLAVEVLSPSDTPAVIYDKLSDYFQYGTRQVWLVDFNLTRVIVYEDDFSTATYEAGDTIYGGDVLPGFSLNVASLFEL